MAYQEDNFRYLVERSKIFFFYIIGRNFIGTQNRPGCLWFPLCSIVKWIGPCPTLVGDAIGYGFGIKKLDCSKTDAEGPLSTSVVIHAVPGIVLYWSTY